MLVKCALTTMAALLTVAVAAAQTAQIGTAAEAKAMLHKAVTALKADRAKALRAFNEGAEGFKDRDLYPFCADAANGVVTAHPKLKGLSLNELRMGARRRRRLEASCTSEAGQLAIQDTENLSFRSAQNAG